ncbi:helix-turn-helix transcriptional regulator [Oleiharenicola lentus]|uniref:helix-turn-helix transcriptional regulator n=1 Tax=Oleiharenicola lentus TaxID=2508720 RepID=UPI003F66B926
MPHASGPFLEQIPLAEWAHLHAHLIWIYDGPVSAFGRTGQREAPHLTAWLLRAGEVELKVRNLHLTACAGEWLFPPAGKVWRRFSEDARILSVRYRASWPSGEELFSDGLGVSLRAKEYPELERAARPLAQFVKKQFPKPDTHLLAAPATLETHLRLQKLFAAWLDASVSALGRAGLVPARMGHIDARLLRAVQLVERHNLATLFAERALADEIGLSVSQLNRLFLHQFGVSSHGYYDRRRREYAIAALRGSSRTVKEVAYELGFSSLPHFSAWAKRRLGHAPRAYRSKATS